MNLHQVIESNQDMIPIEQIQQLDNNVELRYRRIYNHHYTKTAKLTFPCDPDGKLFNK